MNSFCVMAQMRLNIPTPFLSFALRLKLGAIQKDERQAEVQDSVQHAVQGCLIGQCAGEQRLSIWLIVNRQAAKLASPQVGQMAFDTDFIVRRITHIDFLSTGTVYA